MKRGASALLICSSLASALSAQSSGRLEGTVTGPPRAVRGVVVEVTRVHPEPIVTRAAPVDERGRYRLDSLPAGEYALHVASPLLDSLQLSTPDRSVTIAAGRTTADVALPAGPALRDAVCPGLELGKGQGVVTGHALDADTEQPLVGATVVVSWNELIVDRATLKSSSEERIATAPTGDRGEYRLCGVPTGTSLSLQLQQGDRASADVKLAVSDEEGAVARDLSLSAGIAAASAASTASEPSRAAADTSRAAPSDSRTGTATLAGTVRGLAGQPLSSTELRVLGAESVAVSDSAGRFSLGALPAGTQMLVARRIGYEALEVPVELRAGRVAQLDVQLARVVSLDSIRVVALRSRYPQFDFNRRSNPFGVYLGPDELERRKVAQTADFLTGIPGLSLAGHGLDATARSSRGRAGARKCEGMLILLDGRNQGLTLNEISPGIVGAIEIHTQGALAPSEYAIRGSCGVIAIWTKR